MRALIWIAHEIEVSSGKGQPALDGEGAVTSALSRTNVLGVGISAVDMAMAVAEMERWIADGQREYVCIRDAHGIVRCQSDEDLRTIHNRAGMVTPDGMPLVWLSRLHGARHVSRVYGPDLMLAFCERSAARGYRHYFYGGNEGVPERLAAALRARFPDLIVAGTYSPPFRALGADEERAIAERINAARPDIVWVVLSTPKQERWMAANRAHLEASVLVGVGAAFDFHAGFKPQAPEWMQRSGLEWLFRLATEPRRLWRRYAVIVPMFVLLVMLQELGLRRRPL
jgi:N-acetylglucosaminyldiphosphoundecaprenol N-acetyl-beta-D-mannosaminyltransferase